MLVYCHLAIPSYSCLAKYLVLPLCEYLATISSVSYLKCHVAVCLLVELSLLASDCCLNFGTPLLSLCVFGSDSNIQVASYLFTRAIYVSAAHVMLSYVITLVITCTLS